MDVTAAGRRGQLPPAAMAGATLLHAGLWAAAAAAAPLLVRSRRTAPRIGAAILWGSGLAIGALAVAEATTGEMLEPGRVLAAAMVAAGVAAWPRR
jgi:hypothetical protein